MANLRLVFDNLHDSAELSASTEALSIEHTRHSSRAYVWRSTGTADQVLEAKFGQAAQVGALALVRHNFSGNARIRMELMFNNEVIYDTGMRPLPESMGLGVFRAGIDPWGITYSNDLPNASTVLWAPDVGANGYRFTIQDPKNADGFVEVGRIVCGETFSPEINADYGLRLDWVDSTEQMRTEAGTLRSVGGNLFRRLEIDLSMLSDRQRGELTNLMVKSGKRGDVFVSAFPSAGGRREVEYAFLARRVSDWGHEHDFYQNWKGSLTFEEV